MSEPGDGMDPRVREEMAADLDAAEQGLPPPPECPVCHGSGMVRLAPLLLSACPAPGCAARDRMYGRCRGVR